MFYLSLRTLPFGLAVAIEFAGPLAVAIWSSRRAVDFAWVALAIAGLGLLLPLGLNGSTLDPVGVLHALAAAVFWALYIVFGKRAGHLHAGHSVSLGLLVAALVVVPVGVAHAGASLLSPSVPLYSTLVAVEDEHGPAVGVIELPALGQRVFAGRGLGCFVVDVHGERQARVSDTSSIGEALLCTSGFGSWSANQVRAAHGSERACSTRTWVAGR